MGSVEVRGPYREIPIPNGSFQEQADHGAAVRGKRLPSHNRYGTFRIVCANHLQGMNPGYPIPDDDVPHGAFLGMFTVCPRQNDARASL
jgi:hypothetical protein